MGEKIGQNIRFVRARLFSLFHPLSTHNEAGLTWMGSGWGGIELKDQQESYGQMARSAAQIVNFTEEL